MMYNPVIVQNWGVYMSKICGVLPEFWASDMAPVVSEIAIEAAAADWWLPVAALQSAIDEVQILQSVIVHEAAIKNMDMQASKEFIHEVKVLTYVHHLNLGPLTPVRQIQQDIQPTEQEQHQRRTQQQRRQVTTPTRVRVQELLAPV